MMLLHRTLLDRKGTAPSQQRTIVAPWASYLCTTLPMKNLSTVYKIGGYQYELTEKENLHVFHSVLFTCNFSICSGLQNFCIIIKLITIKEITQNILSLKWLIVLFYNSEVLLPSSSLHTADWCIIYYMPVDVTVPVVSTLLFQPVWKNIHVTHKLWMKSVQRIIICSVCMCLCVLWWTKDCTYRNMYTVNSIYMKHITADTQEVISIKCDACSSCLLNLFSCFLKQNFT